MTFKVGISEKKLADKRFKRTEEKILRLFFEDDCCFEMKALAKEASVARSTIYRHHRTMRNIIVDYEKYVLSQYRRMIRKCADNSIRIIYLKTIYFIIGNKNIFKLLMKYSDERIFCKMIMNKRISRTMGLPKNAHILYMVYVSEVARLLYEWGRRGFSEEEIERLLAEILYLTKTARSRLGILLD